MKYLAPIVLALFFLAAPVNAADITLQWTVPATTCDNEPLAAADLTNIEIYIDTAPIQPGSVTDCTAAPVDPPAGFTPTTAGANDASVTISVLGGATYFLRARVQHVNGSWSNLSQETSVDIALGNLRPPTLIVIPLG
jgi:hypothetical protein